MAFTEQCRNIFAVGRNYRAHAEELANPVPEAAIFFSKTPSCLCDGDAVRLPANLGPIHHELEVVLRLGADVPVGQYRDLACVSHLGLGLDFTAREYQSQLKSKGLPWFRAKNFHGAAFVTGWQPFSRDWHHLKFQLLKNGQLVQDGNTCHMLFSPQALLAELNQTLPLRNGDLVFTGTPSGVAPVQHGDILRLVSSDLGIDRTIEIRIG